ncbi:uncharacterized protein LOC143300601 isoform X2 [Babylonia areolata]|uniref:uncharacterized protein LOC143300601 isoform X2 n=1 Tax=Babylonia areolata TaxID=304850 RepID=UPI003FD439D5
MWGWRLHLCVTLLLAVAWMSGPSWGRSRRLKRLQMIEAIQSKVGNISQLLVSSQNDTDPVGVILTKLVLLCDLVGKLPFTMGQLMRVSAERIEEKIDEKCCAASSGGGGGGGRGNSRSAPYRCGTNRLIRDQDGFLMVFRLTAGLGKSPLDRYAAVGDADDAGDMFFSLLPCGCKSANGSLPCDRHFRSVLLDLWPRLAVDKVKVSVYEKGVEKLRVVFDGRSSKPLTFIEQAPILECTLFRNALPRVVTIPGCHEQNRTYQSRFFVQDRCDEDERWLVIGDKPGDSSCPWEDDYADSFPYILYSNVVMGIGVDQHLQPVRRLRHPGKGDVATVSIKLLGNEECQMENALP